MRYTLFQIHKQPSQISSILHPGVGDPAKGYPLRNMDMGDVFELAARQAAQKHPRDSSRASEESEESDSGEQMTTSRFVPAKRSKGPWHLSHR